MAQPPPAPAHPPQRLRPIPPAIVGRVAQGAPRPALQNDGNVVAPGPLPAPLPVQQYFAPLPMRPLAPPRALAPEPIAAAQPAVPAAPLAPEGAAVVPPVAVPAAALPPAPQGAPHVAAREAPRVLAAPLVVAREAPGVVAPAPPPPAAGVPPIRAAEAAALQRVPVLEDARLALERDRERREQGPHHAGYAPLHAAPQPHSQWLDLIRASVLADEAKAGPAQLQPSAGTSYQDQVQALSSALQHGLLTPDQVSKHLSELSSASSTSSTRGIARREDVERILESASEHGAFAEHCAPSGSNMQRLSFGTIFPLSQVRAILNNTPLEKATNSDFKDKLEVVYIVSRLFELRAHSFHIKGCVHDMLTPSVRRDCFEGLLLQCHYAIDLGFDASGELPLELFISFYDELVKICGDAGVSLSRPPKDILAKYRRLALKKEHDEFQVAQKTAAKPPASNRFRESGAPYRRFDRTPADGELCRRFNTYTGCPLAASECRFVHRCSNVHCLSNAHSVSNCPKKYRKRPTSPKTVPTPSSTNATVPVQQQLFSVPYPMSTVPTGTVPPSFVRPPLPGTQLGMPNAVLPPPTGQHGFEFPGGYAPNMWPGFGKPKK